MRGQANTAKENATECHKLGSRPMLQTKTECKDYVSLKDCLPGAPLPLTCLPAWAACCLPSRLAACLPGLLAVCLAVWPPACPSWPCYDNVSDERYHRSKQKTLPPPLCAPKLRMCDCSCNLSHNTQPKTLSRPLTSSSRQRPARFDHFRPRHAELHGVLSCNNATARAVAWAAGHDVLDDLMHMSALASQTQR